jgi:uncharacterized protein (TIGR02246 family)
MMAVIQFLASAQPLVAQGARQAEDQAAIGRAVESYVTLFNQADAGGLAALWSPEAVYTNPVSGEQVVGREAIEQQFTAIFAAAQGAQLAVQTDSIEFVSPNVAVEHGTARVTRADQAPEESEYTAVYVRRDGQWLLDRVTEEVVPTVTSNYEHLQELEWIIGSWIDQDEQSSVATTCQWTSNQNFMTRFFSVRVRDRVELSGLQIVGWDPAAKRIRSWVFDSDGGFGEGVWTKKDTRWYIQSTGTLPDGSSTSSVNIMTYIDDNTFTWQTVNREAGGEILPNVDEVVVVRQSATE